MIHDGMPYDPRQGHGRGGSEVAMIYLHKYACNQRTNGEL